MPEEDRSDDIERIQKLLDRHRKNANYLEEQAAQYGLEVPLALHNALTAEHEAIIRLERELVALGVAPQPKATWQALIIDADEHWREIVVSNIGQLGGSVIELEAIPIANHQEIIDRCAMAIVSASGHTIKEPATQTWIEDIVQLGHRLPIILLASWEDRDISIVLRQAFLNDSQDMKVTTIFKETLDLHWFSRIIQQFLTR